MLNIMEFVRTHTLWMTVKQYKKWSNNKSENITLKNYKTKTKTRTHIYFE